MLDYPLVDVIDLLREHLLFTRRKRQQQDIPTTPKTTPKKERVIYREADDSWF